MSCSRWCKSYKKNLTDCGSLSYDIPTKSGFSSSIDISKSLMTSFEASFTPEDCKAIRWPRDEQGRPFINGKVVNLESFTCQEFNSRENTTTEFLCKRYTKDLKDPKLGLFFSFADMTIDLLKVSFIFIAEGFRIPRSGHPNQSNIDRLLRSIEEHIRLRDSEESGRKPITTQFIFDLIELIHIVHRGDVVRFLDYACNRGAGSISKPSHVGFGGKRSKRRNRKRRKSKKIF